MVTLIFWTNKFIEMVVVLVEIRKIFSWRCCSWMTQDKCIFIGFSILPIKVINGEMTELLEYMSYYLEGLLNLCLNHL
jgi:hypothetical protein